MIQDAINAYHENLTDEIAAETDAQLRTKLRERGLYFGERPLCVVLRPHFYYDADWHYLQHEIEMLLQAFKHAHYACMQSQQLRQQLMLHEYEEALLRYETDVVPWTSSRLDTFFIAESRILNCVEYNAETPAGIGYEDILAEVFTQLTAMKLFHSNYHIRPMPSLSNLLEAILQAYLAWGGKNKPQIGILDWEDVPTRSEHEICRHYFEQNGVSSALADPRELEYRDGQLWKGDFRIDLIYKRVLWSELIDRMGMDNPMVQASRERAVFITNSLSAKLLAKKASLAFLSDEMNAHLFSQAQLAAIHAHIPWTRIVTERKTRYQDQTVDLVQFIADNRERLVLKPNDEYGGKGVIIGWLSSPEEWQHTLQQALAAPYVVQEKVPTRTRDFPMWLDGKLDISERFIDAAPYAFNGTNVHGCLTRLSPVALLNVTAGGGSVVPTFIVSKK